MIFSLSLVVSGATMAQKDGNQRSKAERFFSVLESVNRTVVETFERFEAQGLSVPKEAETKYYYGLSLARESISLMKNGNFSEASEKIVEALKMFEDALKMTHEALQEQPTEAELAAEKAISLKASISRTCE